MKEVIILLVLLAVAVLSVIAAALPGSPFP
jgi:hypothetical protein